MIVPENPYKKGEMLPTERKALFSWVSDAMPSLVLEVGTNGGEGSTFYISNALKFDAKMITCDVRGGCHDYPNLIFVRKPSTTVIKEMIKEGNIPDFIFFDGPEDPNVALQDIKLLEPHLKKGETYFAMHDWYGGVRCYDGYTSTKAALIRPYMEESSNWILKAELRGDVPEDDSVGLVLYQYA